MKGISSLVFLYIFGVVITQVEGRISTKHVFARAPQELDGDGNIGPGPGKGPGKGLGKGLKPPNPAPLEIPTTTTVVTSTSQSSSSIAETVTTTTSVLNTPPPFVFPTRVELPKLTFVPSMISAIQPTSTDRELQTFSITTELPAQTATASTVVRSSQSTSLSAPTSSRSAVVSVVPKDSNDTSSSHQTLVIVLSVVLGSIAIMLVVLVIFLISRFRKRRGFRRGVSPIEDQEIESWRNADVKSPMKSPVKSPIAPLRGLESVEISSGPLASPGWDWFSMDGANAIGAANSRGPSFMTQTSYARSRGPSFMPQASNTHFGISTDTDGPAHSRGTSLITQASSTRHGLPTDTIGPAPSRGTSLVTQAPNARFGLTTDAIPGAEPYIPPVKRQSSRLSKAPPWQHGRSKSMRSSTSARSLRTSNDRERDTVDFTRNEDGPSNWLNLDIRRSPSNMYSLGEASSIGTSVYDEFNTVGGLAPRPKPPSPVFPNFHQPTNFSSHPPVRQGEHSTQTPTETMPGWPLRWS